MKISPLALRVTGFDDEPVWGLAWRLARRQGARIETFCQEHGLKWRDIASGRHVAHIAALAGVDPATVEAATPTLDTGKNITFGSETLASFDLIRSPGRVCPHCLRDDVSNGKGLPEYRTHWRGWWRLRAIAVCPMHSVRLLDYDPTTGKPLNGLAPDPRHAGGPETDLAECRATPVAAAAGEAYLLSRLRSPGSSPHPFLDRFPLQAVIRILDRLGAARVGGREAFTSFDGSVDQHEAIDAGFRMLERGEESLRKFLDELFETAEPANGNWGPREVYGLIYEWLNRDRIHGGTLFDPIRAIVADHALANIPLNPKEPLFGTELPARRLYTLHHVWTETGIHPDRLRPIL